MGLAFCTQLFLTRSLGIIQILDLIFRHNVGLAICMHQAQQIDLSGVTNRLRHHRPLVLEQQQLPSVLRHCCSQQLSSELTGSFLSITGWKKSLEAIGLGLKAVGWKRAATWASL